MAWVNSVQKAQSTMSVLTYLLGPMRSVKDSINGGSTLLSNNNGAVNAMQALLCNYTAITNVTATVFQFTTPDFRRVVTTIPNMNHDLASCTLLPADSPAYPLLILGKSFSGETTIYGKLYYTIYNPVFDALSSSKLIGALFVGVLLS